MPPVRETVVTSFGWSGADLGRTCVESALRSVYGEVVAYLDHWVAMPKVLEVRPTGRIPEWRLTREALPCRREDGDKPDNYIWNAQKFAVKPFVWLDAAEQLGNGVLVWLDADTVIKQPIRRGFFDDLLGDSAVAYLGRGTMHPETGFVAFRIPDALPLLHWCVDCYTTGEFRTFKDGWTDCHVLRYGIDRTRTRARDLTSHLHDEWRSSVDAFALSPLGPYVEHFKGPKRKREALTV